MNNTYLTTEALAERIHYDVRTIRDRLKDSVLIEGKHYFRPFGGRKILYIWEAIERDMRKPQSQVESTPIAAGAHDAIHVTEDAREASRHAVSRGIPMAGGGVCNG
ncbi:hypothetical protein [Salinisphaera sp.]|uniref:hypothetical protein n=1 Tax=Salinisphaera sp. TaxID=1914330 RepID=UPI002D7736B0|nr:hypothetical protein [Salinisphaera sp.]HET7313051.1 hypothetical protein [Salinisphaera sp.]